jgi:NADH-quinone oxidoreductase subunit C
MTTLELVKLLKNRFPEIISEPAEFRGEITLQVADAQKIDEVCAFAKKDLGFDFLKDVCSVDNLGESPRFTVVYHLFSTTHHQHLRLKTNVSEDSCELPTVTGVWRTANWHEREVYDLMGIRFRGHPDLRRIIMWEGYPYNPLRKDFPLAGKPTELPEVANSDVAPMEGGPFVTTPGKPTAQTREPRAKVFPEKTK